MPLSLPAFRLEVSWLWQDPLPHPAACWAQMGRNG